MVDRSWRIATSVVWRVAILACVLAGSLTARAANNCPWFNEASASSILDGNAVGQYTPAAAGQLATCRFTETAGGKTRELVITVETATKPHDQLMALRSGCADTSAPLASIGNEALQCAMAANDTSHGERVIGRVRDQVFTIAISTTAKQDASLGPHELAMRSIIVAEQVSGNLF